MARPALKPRPPGSLPTSLSTLPYTYFFYLPLGCEYGENKRITLLSVWFIVVILIRGREGASKRPIRIYRGFFISIHMTSLTPIENYY